MDRAAAVGVQAVVTIADDLASARWVTEAADADPRVYAAVALHPTRANALTDEAKAVIERLAAHPRVVAVGETGLDLLLAGQAGGLRGPRRRRREAFAWHIDLAKRTGKPLMIHNRDADAEVLDVLSAEGAPETVIFHCFSSGAGDGAHLRGRRLAAEPVRHRQLPQRALRCARPRRLIPPEQLLVETDAPFLTPHPYRGAPNEPYCLPYTVRALAEFVGRPAEEVARRRNYCGRLVRAYGLGELPRLGLSLPSCDRTLRPEAHPCRLIVGDRPRFECFEQDSMNRARRCCGRWSARCCSRSPSPAAMPSRRTRPSR